ncbi:hypothetical protein DPEC_G00272600 [Dallia pectoralis]|uniref:Uncharacterized protein n=1 Tax=Dallia pectoralis TaxID=75939 RepID=A0ACC2FPW9_DALPE|nr:hypothetical protein DPEC_G00272600 [Dallia pectoralis]
MAIILADWSDILPHTGQDVSGRMIGETLPPADQHLMGQRDSLLPVRSKTLTRGPHLENTEPRRGGWIYEARRTVEKRSVPERWDTFLLYFGGE